jgi:hypothetical protein
LRRALALAVVVLGVLAPTAAAATTLNVIPHGQREPGVPWGTAPGMLPAETQAQMYDRLTPLFRDVTDAQLVPSADGTGYYKSAALVDENDPSLITNDTIAGTAPGVGAVSARIKRDAYGVPHIYSDTDAGVIFGAGHARQRGLRGPARALRPGDGDHDHAQLLLSDQGQRGQAARHGAHRQRQLRLDGAQAPGLIAHSGGLGRDA